METKNISLDVSSLLEVLTQDRLVDLGRVYGVGVSIHARKRAQVERLAASRKLTFADVLGNLRRDELKAVCRRFGLDDAGRARPDLMRRLLQERGDEIAQTPTLFGFGVQRSVPVPGDVVRVRHRQYLVESVEEPQGEDPKTHRIRLVGLDDDSQGRALEVIWQLELGAQIMQPEARGLGDPQRLDPPARFGAYLSTLRRHGVTATDSRLFQAPFRAGIKLLNHQLVPLERALELPRANLFIADDVGLGKTIEAGLVLQELRLRQRVELVVVVCPAAICLQWRDELWRRFGLHFEIMNRSFVARRRRERGFGTNPWSTHNRFVVSHSLLRRPEYRDPLLAHLDAGASSTGRARKSLLILDEAHVAAPAAAARYAVDSQITRVIRDVAPRFENRLFLSATPHNGHSNSFSALLELLDPQRFTRGVAVSPQRRDQVMVRRLKSDLQALDVTGFTTRHVVRVELRHHGADDGWRAVFEDGDVSEPVDSTPRPVGAAPPFELELARLLQAYGDAAQPKRKAGKMVLIRLQQRLLSSVPAFYKTLKLHAASVARRRRQDLEAALPTQMPLPDLDGDDLDDTVYGLEEEAVEARELQQVAAASRALQIDDPAAARLDELVQKAAEHSQALDAKVLTLLDWIRRHQCPAVAVGGAGEGTSPADREWTRRRLLVFTEFADTLKYLHTALKAAFHGTDRGAERLARFKGGMGDAKRETIQRQFNGDPDEYPVRVLLATDAAREGVNLQGACYDLFHFDVPWNPGRLEQRNGRIDRTLQPSPHVGRSPARRRHRVSVRQLARAVSQAQSLRLARHRRAQVSRQPARQVGRRRSPLRPHRVRQFHRSRTAPQHRNRPLARPSSQRRASRRAMAEPGRRRDHAPLRLGRRPPPNWGEAARLDYGETVELRSMLRPLDGTGS